MDAFFLQLLNGLDKGSAYALIALGLTIIFGTLGVVNFAHGALFMIGAFCAVIMQRIFKISQTTIDETRVDFMGNPLPVETPYVEVWFGDFGSLLIDYSVPVSILLAIPVMLLIGVIMERGLIKYFYKRPHAEQILVTFGLAIVLQEIVKAQFGANPIPQPTPDDFVGSTDFGVWLGFGADVVTYPTWRFVYFIFALLVIGGVFAFLQFTTFGMVVRAGMADRETVGLLGINIDRRFTLMFGLAAAVAGLAGVMYTPIQPPDYHWGMDFLVLSFVVVVVGGMGSLGGAVAAGFLLGIVQSFSAVLSNKEIPLYFYQVTQGLADFVRAEDFSEITRQLRGASYDFDISGWTIAYDSSVNLPQIPGLDQIIIYLVAVIVLLTRPRGLMGRKGVMES